MAGEPLYMSRLHYAGSALLVFVVDVVFRVSEDANRAPLFNNVGALLFFLFFFKQERCLISYLAQKKVKSKNKFETPKGNV